MGLWGERRVNDSPSARKGRAQRASGLRRCESEVNVVVAGFVVNKIWLKLAGPRVEAGCLHDFETVAVRERFSSQFTFLVD